MLIPKFLSEQRHHFVTKGFDIAAWTTRDILRVFGIRYAQIFYYERKGIIKPLTRNERGRISATPYEVYLMLTQLELRARNWLEEYQMFGYHPRKRAISEFARQQN